MEYILVKCEDCKHEFKVPEGTRSPYKRYCNPCAMRRQPQTELTDLLNKLRNPGSKGAKNP